MEDRKVVLLRAALDMLKKLDVSDPLGELYVYDEIAHPGARLMEDIEAELTEPDVALQMLEVLELIFGEDIPIEVAFSGNPVAVKRIKNYIYAVIAKARGEED